jgi:pimeloyl-ACP methyl ester carboxylesterase
MYTDHTLFNQLYANVDTEQRQALLAFRNQYPAREWEYEGAIWRYITLGKGATAALFLPGAAGSYDIWWQQLLALSDDLHLISISYPPLNSLECLHSGLNVLLRREGVERCHIIGSSMGGYLAQYIASTQPDILKSAIFANTFVPTLPILRTAPLLRLAISVMPFPWIEAIYRWFTQLWLVPSGENNPLLKAYLMEVSYAGLGRRDFLARLACVTQRFNPIQANNQCIPLLIIDSDNDPLIRPGIRQAMRMMYPSAQRYSFKNAGHFSYLNQPEIFTSVVRSFLQEL